MTAHDHTEPIEDCYRCELNRDEIEANRLEDERDAATAWIEYRDAFAGSRRRLRKRDFIAGFLSGRDWS